MRFLFLLLIVIKPVFLWAQCNNSSAPKTIVATVEGSQATIKILDGQLNERYHIFRLSFSTNVYEEIGNTTSTQYSDNQVDPAAGVYYYYVKAENACGALTDASNTACTIHLKGTGRTLQWNSPLPNSTATIKYKVSKINAPLIDLTGWQLSNKFTLGNQTQPNDTYRITALVTIQVNGQPSTIEIYSSLYELIDVPAVYIPDAFTPNYDGINDTLEISTFLIQSYSIQIYDRFGSEIFTSNSPNSYWDGLLHNGYPAPSQVYTYSISIVDFFNESWQQTGRVLLLK